MLISTKRFAGAIFHWAVVICFCAIAGAAVSCAALAADAAPVYKNPAADVEARINDLLPRLTLEEKILMVHGDENTGMDTTAIARLGIPRLSMTDGPHGVRWGQATAFPPGVSLGATWNEALLERVGAAIGRETLAKGRNIILGPCINIHRQPFGGRNFESYSEDPFLAGRLAVGYVKGVQGQHCVATPKHYAVNNQEFERMTISAEISERAMREIYLPHFRMAVQEADAWSVMCSYNRINGTYACENPHLQIDILKKEWGFRGFVMSDWGAVHSTAPTAMSGMDVEMPHGQYLGADLLKAVKDGAVPEKQIDAMVRNVLRVMFVSGIFDGQAVAATDWLDSPFHRAVALDAARESITLLKNDNNVLPFKRNKIKTVAVIGPGAAVPHLGGGGSSQVTPTHAVTPLEGIAMQAGPDVEVRYTLGCETNVDAPFAAIPVEYLAPSDAAYGATGLLAEYYEGEFASGPGIVRVEPGVNRNWGATGDEAPGLRRDNFSVRWTGALTPPESGKYKLVLLANDGSATLYVDGKTRAVVYALNGVYMYKDPVITLEAGRAHDIKVEFKGTGTRASAKLGWLRRGENPLDQAAQLAASSDAAVVIVSLDRSIEGEGNDRETLSLPGLQDELIKAVVAAQPNTAVVLANGTPVLMDKWLDATPALVEAWYPGQEGGRAIAEVLFGDVNPSGHMPVSFPVSWEKSAAYPNYPGADGKVAYDEDILVGYRWHDTRGVAPLFPFGHGLSFTTFAYSNLKINVENAKAAAPKAVATVDVKNTGSVAGKAVAQLYVKDDKASVLRPEQELKGFNKILLQPGETQTVSFTLDAQAFSYFDEKSMKWVAEPGRFEIRVGNSSRDIQLKGEVVLK
jgi:beta-glucosidase